jgi:hypothetical protein
MYCVEVNENGIVIFCRRGHLGSQQKGSQVVLRIRFHQDVKASGHGVQHAIWGQRHLNHLTKMRMSRCSPKVTTSMRTLKKRKKKMKMKTKKKMKGKMMMKMEMVGIVTHCERELKSNAFLQSVRKDLLKGLHPSHLPCKLVENIIEKVGKLVSGQIKGIDHQELMNQMILF